MARKKKTGNSSKESASSASIDAMDDIDLLNLYRYPEAFPEKQQQELKNSRSAQKRIEELMRMAGRSYYEKRGHAGGTVGQEAQTAGLMEMPEKTSENSPEYSEGMGDKLLEQVKRLFR